jgi:hypothetical protein
MFNKPSLRKRVIKALVSAVVDGEAFPKIDEDTICSRYDIFALASEFDELIGSWPCVETSIASFDGGPVIALHQ